MESSPTLLDPSLPDVRVEFGIARAEHAQRTANTAFAHQLDAVHGILMEAREFPHVYAPGGEVEYAERAAVADLAVRMSVAEGTVRAWDFEAQMLLGRLPRLWAATREGLVSPAHLRVATELVGVLPAAVWELFDAGVVSRVGLAPARFKTAARLLAEKLNPVEVAERHAGALDKRRVWVDADIDSMAWLNAYVGAEIAVPFNAWLDAEAFKIFTAEGETRTLAQIRADIFADILMGKQGAGSVGVTVGVLVPVLTLMSLSEEPGTLEGYGPIDAETARRLAAKAPSFYRLLTHPITGAILELDRTSYRPPADIERLVILRDQLCTFPGCGRRASECDLDHTIDWAAGGTTSFGNLSAVCRSHHTLKHKSRWSKRQNPDTSTTWTSPTGHEQNNDPPPY